MTLWHVTLSHSHPLNLSPYHLLTLTLSQPHRYLNKQTNKQTNKIVNQQYLSQIMSDLNQTFMKSSCGYNCIFDGLIIWLFDNLIIYPLYVYHLTMDVWKYELIIYDRAFDCRSMANSTGLSLYKALYHPLSTPSGGIAMVEIKPFTTRLVHLLVELPW